MSEFYLVRHGQASFGAENYDKLSDLGIQQSVWLGEYFKQRHIHFDQVLTGTLVRHQETAKGICAGLEDTPPVMRWAQLNEFDFTRLAQAYLSLYPEARPGNDAPRADFYRLLKKAMLAWSIDELPMELLAESWGEFRQRIFWALTQIREQHQNKRILIVSSGGAIAMLMSLVLACDAKQVINLNLQIKNTAFSQFYFNPKDVRLSNFNNVPHLDDPARVDAITYS